MSNISLDVGRRLENDGQRAGFPKGGQEFLFLRIPAASGEGFGTQMVLNQYLLSDTMPDTAKAKKTLTLEFHRSQKADIFKKIIQSNLVGRGDGTVKRFPVKNGPYNFILFSLLKKHPSKTLSAVPVLLIADQNCL